MDSGHLKLLKALGRLQTEALEHDFHDYKSRHVTPKIKLVQKLSALIDHVKSGKFDDKPDDLDTAALKKEMVEGGMSPEMIGVIFGGAET